MRACLFPALLIALTAISRIVVGADDPLTDPRPLEFQAEWVSALRQSTADHTQFEELQQHFASGPEVTAACISCHNQAADEVMKTYHWTWTEPAPGGELIGKAGHVVNNFCISLLSNEPRCTSCHSGYGWEDNTFDFTNRQAVDCLVCHDTTGSYVKFPSDAGHPAYETKEFGGREYRAVNLTEVAQNVGRTSRHTCGMCHFFGGGGEGVKHGDLDYSLFNPTHEIDVHMDAAGLNFQCTECHTTEHHVIAGPYDMRPAARTPDRVLPGHKAERISCTSCHGRHPHPDSRRLNAHTDKVSCQACHIPRYALKKPTKVWWDWSKAGLMDEDGKPFERTNEQGHVVYMSKKGEMEWVQNAVPEYAWWNGDSHQTFLTDVIDPKAVVPVNHLRGGYNDPGARIWPVKVHRGRQPYDAVRNTLVAPHLYGPEGSDAYWASFDWDRAVASGMEYAGLPFSGEVGFVETEMYWTINHMVAPADRAVSCHECHTPNGRLANLGGFYMPGRDRFPWLDWVGIGLIALACAGVTIHGGLRIATRRGKCQ